MNVAWGSVFALVFPCAALACKTAEHRYFACSFEKGRKTVEICHDAQSARYEFGPADGAAELELSRPVTEVYLTPWPGIGRTIWEEITFYNKSFGYTVHASVERVLPENEEDEIVSVLSGGIFVERDGIEVARLECDPGSVDFPWGTELFDAKEAAGQCYDRVARTWSSCSGSGNASE